MTNELNSKRDFPEDFKFKNGNYFHKCFECGEDFYGHKHRRICKLCTGVEIEEDKPKDFLGNVIEVGDEVVFMQKNYRNFMRGKIKSISKQKCVIVHDRTNIGGKQTIQFHNQVIVDVKKKLDKMFEPLNKEQI
jgi:hypothetical protein